MKPILACDYDPRKGDFPYMGFPKIDGVRSLNIKGRLVGRSGKQFKNKLNTEFYSNPLFEGFDGEMVVDRITGYGICNETTSALGTIEGDIGTRWCLFDYVIDGFNNHEPYYKRHSQMWQKVFQLYDKYPSLREKLWVIPFVTINNSEELNEYEIKAIENQYEGIILRSPGGVYKYGRCTAREANYLRLKRFMDAEIVVTGIVEGKSNQNELKRNPHGYAERSTFADGMVPNGMIGALVGEAVEDVLFNSEVIIKKGSEVEVSAGKMSHNTRKELFERPNLVLGQIAKYQFFPVGVKDKPRFPTFQGFRDPVDMG